MSIVVGNYAVTDFLNAVRLDNRVWDELRPMTICAGVNSYAEGSAEISVGNTKVLVTATVEREVPRWMSSGAGGWITAEYGMLPRSTHTRNRREASSGKQGGRTLEIQRLIGRSLRRAVDLHNIGEITVKIDCDVLQADGGTRTAAISGGWVALYQALQWSVKEGLSPSNLDIRHVAAVSVGMVKGRCLVDLCYEEDSTADFDLNVVANEQEHMIEVQGTGEQGDVSIGQFQELLSVSLSGISKIIDMQKRAIAS